MSKIEIDDIMLYLSDYEKQILDVLTGGDKWGYTRKQLFNHPQILMSDKILRRSLKTLKNKNLVDFYPNLRDLDLRKHLWRTKREKNTNK